MQVEHVKLYNMNWIEKLYYFNDEWNTPLSKEHLIEQGKCCANGCKNCPYTKPRVKGNTKLE